MVTLYDTTLRDGMQGTEVNYTLEDKARILANHLYFAGVPQEHIAALVESRGYQRRDRMSIQPGRIIVMHSGLAFYLGLVKSASAQPANARLTRGCWLDRRLPLVPFQGTLQGRFLCPVCSRERGFHDSGFVLRQHGHDQTPQRRSRCKDTVVAHGFAVD